MLRQAEERPGTGSGLGSRLVHAAWLDVPLYALCAGFAGLTAVASTLPAHRAWGAVAWVGYAVCALMAVGQTLLRRRTVLTGPTARAWLALVAWLTTAALPLVLLSMDRARGRSGRAQEEVIVIEDAGRRLLETGTPYLDRSAIAALPEPLLGYVPYQPAMALFGVPRALDPGAHWWSDARVWFALVTAALVAAGLRLLRRTAADPDALVWAVQAVAVLPLATLTLATGGDDLPVLALCLFALALAATHRWGWAGATAGVAAALKLIAWPVALVLAVHALTQRRIGRFGLFLVLPPVLTGLPAALVNPPALVENVIAFPLGQGLVKSPAASPLPGYLLATAMPGGRGVAVALLLGAGAGMGLWLLLRPPRTAAAAAGTSAVGLLVATMLLPATRFGYLLYPAALALWAPALLLPWGASGPEIARPAPDIAQSDLTSRPGSRRQAE
ncbi:MAG TPA: glycosyltransferase 87 family protein [Micromonosporaceae bacterium]|nr:glycosyltransferase 87 family protein [Micromonosporaceae bacterium]